MGDEAKRKIGEDLLTYAQLSKHLAETHIAENDWSGLPVPVAGLQLVLEPRYKRKELSEFRWKEFYDEHGNRHALTDELLPAQTGLTRVNSWWNANYQFSVVIVHDEKGRAQVRLKFEDRLAFTIRTLEAASVWPVEAERKAVERLAGLIPPDQHEIYLLTGHFAEVSKRSRLTYLFRRGRPTIVLRQDEEANYPLCALCLHPIGYYGDTWAGVMCPTDEVIAHLLMMRGCEAKLWANANQHPIDHPAAGV
jgi:hypothetical protein